MFMHVSASCSWCHGLWSSVLLITDMQYARNEFRSITGLLVLVLIYNCRWWLGVSGWQHVEI